MKLSRRHALILAAALPGGCMSPNPSLYTLAPVHGQTRARAPRHVEVRGVSLPHYLERSEIVRSTYDYRVVVLPNDWWGESLSSMLNRVLIQDLSQRLPNSTVFSDTSAISATPDATVSVNISRFDEDRSGMAVLQAQVAISGSHSGSRDVRLTAPVSGPAPAALVGAMSAALGKLAGTIADMLTGRSGSSHAH